MTELYLENGKKAGLYDVAEWWLEKYPEDIFVEEPKSVVEIRERMKLILSVRKDEPNCFGVGLPCPKSRPSCDLKKACQNEHRKRRTDMNRILGVKEE